jgi:hypothetical protein
MMDTIVSVYNSQIKLEVEQIIARIRNLTQWEIEHVKERLVQEISSFTPLLSQPEIESLNSYPIKMLITAQGAAPQPKSTASTPPQFVTPKILKSAGGKMSEKSIGQSTTAIDTNEPTSKTKCKAKTKQSSKTERDIMLSLYGHNENYSYIRRLDKYLTPENQDKFRDLCKQTTSSDPPNWIILKDEEVALAKAYGFSAGTHTRYNASRQVEATKYQDPTAFSALLERICKSMENAKRSNPTESLVIQSWAEKRQLVVQTPNDCYFFNGVIATPDGIIFGAEGRPLAVVELKEIGEKADSNTMKEVGRHALQLSLQMYVLGVTTGYLVVYSKVVGVESSFTISETYSKNVVGNQRMMMDIQEKIENGQRNLQTFRTTFSSMMNYVGHEIKA